MPCPALQGAFKRVATEVEACARELAAILRRRLLAAPDQAAECIQMIAKLGEPTESLQVGCLLPCWPAGLAAVLPGGFVTVQSKRMLLAPLPACPAPPACLQEDFLECKRQRLEGLLAAAGLMLKTLAVDKGLLSAAGGQRCFTCPLVWQGVLLWRQPRRRGH